LVIAAVSLIFYLVYTGFYSRGFCWQYFVGGLLIAAVSWLDDLYTVPVIGRLAVQGFSALLVVSSLVSADNLSAPTANIYEIVTAVFVFLWIVWLTNAYNFMDGIDGIASLQAVVAGIGWLAAGFVLSAGTAGFYGGVLAFSGLGFLIQNWQPAKIFMGDVGSAFLGFSFAVLPILAVRETGENFERFFFTAAALVWLFVFDTIFTFCRRAFKREKVWQPHRSHIYQRLVIAGFPHRKIAGLYGALTFITGIFAVAALLNTNYNKWLWLAILLESIILISMLKIFEKPKKSKR